MNIYSLHINSGETISKSTSVLLSGFVAQWHSVGLTKCGPSIKEVGHTWLNQYKYWKEIYRIILQLPLHKVICGLVFDKCYRYLLSDSFITLIAQTAQNDNCTRPKSYTVVWVAMIKVQYERFMDYKIFAKFSKSAEVTGKTRERQGDYYRTHVKHFCNILSSLFFLYTEHLSNYCQVMSYINLWDILIIFRIFF